MPHTHLLDLFVPMCDTGQMAEIIAVVWVFIPSTHSHAYILISV